MEYPSTPPSWNASHRMATIYSVAKEQINTGNAILALFLGAASWYPNELDAL